MVNLIRRFVAEEEGLELLEYAILAAVLGLGLITIYSTFGGSISSALSRAQSALNAQAGSTTTP